MKCSPARCSARRNKLVPGDHVAAIINGRRRTLTIVGVALSPEYVYAIRPGDIFPDKNRFGLFWMGHEALASAFNMEGGFNDVSLKLARGASPPDVVAALDRLTAPYGGFGALPRAQQVSAWTLENELTQLQSFGFLLPLIFLGVAAFILNVALTRAHVAAARADRGAQGARLFESGACLALHQVGARDCRGRRGVGVVFGAWLGSGMVSLYNEFFRFPTLDYHVSLDVGGRVADRQPDRGGAGRAVGRSACREDSSGRSDAARAAGAVPSQPPRATVAPLPPAARHAHDRAQPRAAAGARADVGHRYRVRRRGAARRTCRSSTSWNVLIDAAVPSGDAAGRHGESSWSRGRCARLYDVEHIAGRDGRRADAQRAGPTASPAHDSRTLGITGLPGAPTLNRIVDRSGHVLTLPAEWPRAVENARRDSATSAPATRCGSKCSAASAGARRAGRGAGRRQHGTAGLHAHRCAEPSDARGRDDFGGGDDRRRRCSARSSIRR